MEYLVLVGGDIKGALSNVLGDAGPFFWSAAAPLGLAILWILSIHALLASWFQSGKSGVSEKGRGNLVLRLLFSVILMIVILASGSAIEFLLLGEGFVHSHLLAGALDIIRPG